MADGPRVASVPSSRLQPICKGAPVNDEKKAQQGNAEEDAATSQAKRRFLMMKAVATERRAEKERDREPTDPLRDFWGRE